MNIKTLIGIKDCILVIYCGLDRLYRYSITSIEGETYTCNCHFPTSSSAKFMGVAAVERLAIKRRYK